MARDQRAARDRDREAAEQEERRRRDRRVLLIAVVVFVLLVGGGIGLQSWRTGRLPDAVPGASMSSSPMTLTDGQPLRLGSASAPVTVTLYEDFHCPHCADFEEKFGSVLTRAQHAGTVRLELYPMSFIDDGSVAAANAMACAAVAGFGQPYYLGLFANHGLTWNDKQLVALAGAVGGTATDSFRSCVTTRGQAAWVSSINDAADANGVTGTPTVLVDKASVDVTGLTPAGLQSMIDQAART